MTTTAKHDDGDAAHRAHHADLSDAEYEALCEAEAKHNAEAGDPDDDDYDYAIALAESEKAHEEYLDSLERERENRDAPKGGAA